MWTLITGEDVEVETLPKQRTPESNKKGKQMIKTPTDILQNKLVAEGMKTPNEKQWKNKSLIEKQQQNRTPSEKQQQKNRTPSEKQQKNRTPNEKQQKNKTPNEKQQQGATPKSSPGTQVNVMLHYIIIIIIIQPSDTFRTKCSQSLAVVIRDFCTVMFTFLLL